MSIQQLKQTLIEQDAKDKKKTFLIATLAYLIFFILIVIFACLWSLVFYGKDIFSYINENYLRHSLSFNIVFFLLAAGAILFPLYHTQKYNYRKKEIERLINYLNQGSKAHTIKVLTKYKLNIPYFGKTFKYFPVKTIYIILDKDNRPFRFPLSSFYIPQVEKVLIK